MSTDNTTALSLLHGWIAEDAMGTPDDQRQQWYLEMAEYFGRGTISGMEGVTPAAAAFDARLAAHFGRLALGAVQTLDLDETETDYETLHRASVAAGNRCIVEDCKVCRHD